MKNIKTILVPYNFSTISRRALNYATAFAGSDEDITILLAHITDQEDTETVVTAFKVIENEVKTSFRGTITSLIRQGTLTETLVDLQKSETIDLIVMGTSGDADANNTVDLALEIDDCPVIAIPDTDTEFGIRKIALVLGKDKIQDRTVLETLLRITRRFNAEVIVLTIQNEAGIYGYSENDESNENLLEYYLEDFYSHHSFIENSDIVKGVLDYVNDHAIDMIAILPRNHADKKVRSEGLLTKELTFASKVPVLTID